MAISPAGSGAGLVNAKEIVTLAHLHTSLCQAIYRRRGRQFRRIRAQLITDDLNHINALFKVRTKKMTMLHCVAKYLEDKVDIVRDLLAVGADPTIKTSTGKDAYKLALKAGNEGVAAILKPLCQEEKRASE